jgi:uncharacterized protein (TIGR00369 family)
MEYKHIEESQLVMTQLMLPSYSNFRGYIHGGYVLSLMDQVAFACSSKHSGHFCVTASVNKVDFLTPIEVGELLTLKASVNYTGRTSMVVGLRVESENIKTGSKKHCNSSYFTMVAVDGDGKTTEVPGLKISTKIDAKRFIKAIKRRESEAERNSDLDKIYKDVEQHLNLLKDYRVQIDIK